MEANRSAVAGRFGRSQPGSRQAGVVNKSRASVCASQPGSGQAGGQGGPPFGVDGMKKPRASVRASQPGSRQAGGQYGPFRVGGNQGTGAIASCSLWQTGV
ncbi:hypothetical protein [Burkholderia sp. Bp9143]|uniref:hypothetical protein n=1 Tax=Burkholderia sp. Bp9143 TaxID=2184574 RepID=UPI000F595084|nr:hypothetical protein [Burkholderia sp. Bp9143]